MNSEIFEILWQGGLQADFKAKASSLFLSDEKPSRLIASQVPLDAGGSSSPALSGDSEDTCVSRQYTFAIPTGRDSYKVIESIQDLETARQSQSKLSLFLVQQSHHSWSPLNLTQDLFDKLCFDMRTSNALRNLISHMGERDADEVAPPSPHWQHYEKADGDKMLEMCYALRYVAETHKPNSEPWSIRQFVIHSKSVAGTNDGSWIFIALPEACFDDAAKLGNQSETSVSSINHRLHVLMFHQSLICWRKYIAYLGKEVSKCNCNLAFAAPSGATSDGLPAMRIRLRDLEDQVEDAKISLLGNISTMLALRQPLSHLSANTGSQSLMGTASILDPVEDSICKANQIISQLDFLTKRLASCTDLASSYLDLSNGKALHDIGVRTADMAEANRRDAATMLVLTVIASICLPTTLVLNFFSTSFVEIENGGIVVAKQWWVFLVIAAVLTCFILIAWKLRVRRVIQELDKRRNERSGEHVC